MEGVWQERGLRLVGRSEIGRRGEIVEGDARRGKEREFLKRKDKKSRGSVEVKHSM